MKIEPLVSIGIPTYNRPEELRRCLEGLISQTYRNLEVIVSDNASPDDATAEVLREFMQRDGRIQYFRQVENRGALFNFQFVLDKTVGEFFMWAADDDYRAPTYVAELVGFMQASPECSIAFCDFQEMEESGEKADGYPEHYPLLLPFTSGSMLVRLFRYVLQTESKGKANLIYGLMRRSALKDFKWNEFVREHGEYGVDMLFVFTMLQRGRLALAKQRLYRCTVGNQKAYLTVAPLRFREKLFALLAELARQLRYSIQYLRITKGWPRLALALIWPIKALDICAHIYLVPKITQLLKLVREWFTRTGMH